MPQGRSATVSPFELVGLASLMALSRGSAAVSVGVVDGPVATDHPALAGATIRMIGRTPMPGAAARRHGTFVVGLLHGICPGCTILARPIFGAEPSAQPGTVASTAEELAAAIIECVTTGARVVNVSAALANPSPNAMLALQRAADIAARHGCLLVVAAGNQGAVGGSALTRHPWVIPVTACDASGRPLALSNFAATIGRGGISAPGEQVTSLADGGGTTTGGGTSAAAPFVTGAVALIASLLPNLPGTAIRYALSPPGAARRSIVPPLLNAWRTYQDLLQSPRGDSRHGATSTEPARSLSHPARHARL